MDGEISPAEVADRVDGPDAPTVVDVRPPAAFARGHLPGSVNVPFPQVPARAGEFADADRVVTVCPHGKSSVRAARLVAAHEAVDARVESMAGGLAAYEGPLTTGRDGGATDGDARADEGPDAPF